MKLVKRIHGVRITLWITLFLISNWLASTSAEAQNSEHQVWLSLTNAEYKASDGESFWSEHEVVGDFDASGSACGGSDYCKLYLYNRSSSDSQSCLLIEDIKIMDDSWVIGPDLKAFLAKEKTSKTLCKDFGHEDIENKIIIDFKPKPGADDTRLQIQVQQTQPKDTTIVIPEELKFNQRTIPLDKEQYRGIIEIPIYKSKVEPPVEVEEPDPTPSPTAVPGIISIGLSKKPFDLHKIGKPMLSLASDLDPTQLRQDAQGFVTLYLYNLSQDPDTVFRVTDIFFKKRSHYTLPENLKNSIKQKIFAAESEALEIKFKLPNEKVVEQGAIFKDQLNISIAVVKGDKTKFLLNGKEMLFGAKGTFDIAVPINYIPGTNVTRIWIWTIVGIIGLGIVVLTGWSMRKVFNRLKNLFPTKNIMPTYSTVPRYRDDVHGTESDYKILQNQIIEIRAKTTEGKESIQRLSQEISQKMDRSMMIQLISTDTIDRHIRHSPLVQEMSDKFSILDIELPALSLKYKKIQDDTFAEIERLKQHISSLEIHLETRYVSKETLKEIAKEIESNFANECRIIQDELKAKLIVRIGDKVNTDSGSLELIYWISQKYVAIGNMINATQDLDVSNLQYRLGNLRKSLAGISGKGEDADMSVLEKNLPDIPILFPKENQSECTDLLKRLIQIDVTDEIQAYQDICDTFARQRKKIDETGVENFQKRYIMSNGFSTFARLIFDAGEDLGTEKETLDAMYHELKRRCDVREIVVKINGQKFDPEMHDVIREETSLYPQGTVIDVYERGYLYQDKVYQKAKVCISRGRQ